MMMIVIVTTMIEVLDNMTAEGKKQNRDMAKLSKRVKGNSFPSPFPFSPSFFLFISPSSCPPCSLPPSLPLSLSLSLSLPPSLPFLLHIIHIHHDPPGCVGQSSSSTSKEHSQSREYSQ